MENTCKNDLTIYSNKQKITNVKLFSDIALKNFELKGNLIFFVQISITEDGVYH